MGNFVQTLSAEFHGHDVHVIEFRPGEVGRILIAGHIVNPVRAPKGELDYGIIVSLLRPGQTAPLVSKQTTATSPTSVTLDYTVTSADLLAAGNWTCQIQNVSGPLSTLAASVSYPTGWPIHTASFDLELLNLLIREALKVARPTVHLQSSPSSDVKQSKVSWSEAATAFLGESPLWFHVGEFDTSWHSIDLHYRVVDLNTQDITAWMSLGAPPMLMVRITFVTSGVQLPGSVDVELTALQGDLQITFDGSIAARFSAAAHTSTFDLDESTTVADSFASSFQNITSRANVRAKLNQFFVGLLRLGPTAVVTGYTVASGALIVSYAKPEPVLSPPGPRPIPFQRATQEQP